MNTGGRVLVAVLDLDNGFEAGKVGLLQNVARAAMVEAWPIVAL
jgi:hypothetical protein